MGTLNRNRGSGDKLSLNRQEEMTGQKCFPVFWSDPQLMNTYWKPAIELLREIETSEEKRDWCKEYSAYAPQADKHGLMRDIERFIEDTYKKWRGDWKLP